MLLDHIPYNFVVDVHVRMGEEVPKIDRIPSMGNSLYKVGFMMDCRSKCVTNCNKVPFDANARELGGMVILIA
jgi:hypothetical protein